MTSDLVLTRTRRDRRLYTLAGVGTLRLSGWASRHGTADADGRCRDITRLGVWRQTIEATDTTGGVVVGVFQGRMRRGGGVLRWSGRDLDLRREGMWRAAYVLSDGGRTLATIEGKSYGRHPVKVAARRWIRLRRGACAVCRVRSVGIGGGRGGGDVVREAWTPACGRV